MTDEQKKTEETKPETAPAEQSAPAAAAQKPASAGTASGNSAPGGRGGRGGFGGRGRGPGGQGGRGGRGGRRGPRQGRGREKPEFESKTLDLARVARVTKGGKRFSFRATVVAGDQKSRVGVGIGKGQDVQRSIAKAYAKAKKDMMNVIIVNGTIPYQVEAKFSSAKVLLKPSKGGIKAGGAVRVVAQLAGIHSLTGKNLGRTNNKLNIARATMAALKKLRHTEASRKAAAAAEAKKAQAAAKREKEKEAKEPKKA